MSNRHRGPLPQKLVPDDPQHDDSEVERRLKAATDNDLVYFGSSRGMERSLLPPTGVRCAFVPMAPPTSPRGFALLAIATLRSLALIARVRPSVTLATGGYASTPATAASWLFRVPVVLFLPDIVPGKAVAWLAPLSRTIAVTTEESVASFPGGKAVVTGYPLRDAFKNVSRDAGRQRFGIPEGEPVVCVFGGSQGARHINAVVGKDLENLLQQTWIIHVCGEQRLREAQVFAERLPPGLRNRYALHPYLHEEDMALALAGADLAVCRAGASVLGELPATRTPAVLVPLPQKTVHQRENAEYLADRGAAIIVSDERVEHDLVPTIHRLLSNGDVLRRMTEACASLARPDAAAAIVDLMESVAQ